MKRFLSSRTGIASIVVGLLMAAAGIFHLASAYQEEEAKSRHFLLVHDLHNQSRHFEDMLRTTVRVSSSNGTALGVIISPDGLVVTTASMVAETPGFEVTSGAAEPKYAAELVHVYRRENVAVIRLRTASDKRLPFALISDEFDHSRDVGRSIYLVGGERPRLKRGTMFSERTYSFSALGGATMLHEIAFPPDSITSGAPVFDPYGNLLAIAVGVSKERSTVYAAPIVDSALAVKCRCDDNGRWGSIDMTRFLHCPPIDCGSE